MECPEDIVRTTKETDISYFFLLYMTIKKTSDYACVTDVKIIIVILLFTWLKNVPSYFYHCKQIIMLLIDIQILAAICRVFVTWT